MLLVGVFTMPEPEPNSAADASKYHRREYPTSYSPPPGYSKPAYPKEEPYKQPDYGKKYEYCDPRATPKCVKNDAETICLKDEEYPAKEIEVKLIHSIN